ncbi:MAG: T9SS type A sorting domain-containing protein [Bacteroidota bacterium]
MVSRFRLLRLGVLALVTASGVLAQDALRPHVYPNPVAANRVVTVEFDAHGTAEAEVVDLLGHEVDPRGNLAAGTYMVRMRHADGRISAPAALTLATPGALELRLRARPLSAGAPSPSSTIVPNEFALVYIIGDSHAAGKGDEAASCALRPDAGSHGLIYQRSSDSFFPVCSPEVDLFNGSIIPALVDEIFQRYGKKTLVVSYTVKGSHLTPEATPSPLYWYLGDSDVRTGDAFRNGKTLLKRAKRAAQRDLDAIVIPAALIQSVGSVDAKQYQKNGAPVPEIFRTRLTTYDRFLARSNLTPFYFEIGPAPGQPRFDVPAAEYRVAMASVVPAERIAYFSAYTLEQHHATGSGYSRAQWYADKNGHLGSLGLDYLGTQLASLLDL